MKRIRDFAIVGVLFAAMVFLLGATVVNYMQETYMSAQLKWFSDAPRPELTFTQGETISNTPDGSLTMAAIVVTDGITLGDDENLTFGTTTGLWTANFDASVDSQLIFLTADTSAAATTDPMYEIITGTNMLADQQIFGVAKGTQASNTALLTIDEDGDLIILNDFSLDFDAAVLNFGDDQDVNITHVADAALRLNAAMMWEFRDADLSINSSADGQLDIDADTEIELATTTVDLNGALDVSGSSTLTGGVIFPSMTTVVWTTGGPATSTTAPGADVACSDGDRYWSEVQLPYNVTLTGISYLVGSVGGTDSVIVDLYNSAGTNVASSDAGGAAAIVGTAAQIQSVAFSSTYAAAAGKYYISLQFNGTTGKFRGYDVTGSKFIAASAGGTFSTPASITPGTTWTTSKGPVAALY